MLDGTPLQQKKLKVPLAVNTAANTLSSSLKVECLVAP